MDENDIKTVSIVDHLSESEFAARAGSLPALESRIVVTPGICGGKPRVRGTRIPVWLLEQSRRDGCSLEKTAATYSLTASDVTEAWAYATKNAESIAAQIAENEAV